MDGQAHAFLLDARPRAWSTSAGSPATGKGIAHDIDERGWVVGSSPMQAGSRTMRWTLWDLRQLGGRAARVVDASGGVLPALYGRTDASVGAIASTLKDASR
jgi:hypothetical protein